MDDIEKLLDRSHIPLPDKKVILFLITELVDKQSRGAQLEAYQHVLNLAKIAQVDDILDGPRIASIIENKIQELGTELEAAPKPSMEKAEDE